MTDNPLERQPGGTHYKKLSIQPIEYILANSIPYPEGNIIKYATRWRDKGGIQDLEKIKHYCDLLIAHEESVNRQPKIHHPYVLVDDAEIEEAY